MKKSENVKSIKTVGIKKAITKWAAAVTLFSFLGLSVGTGVHAMYKGSVAAFNSKADEAAIERVMSRNLVEESPVLKEQVETKVPVYEKAEVDAQVNAAVDQAISKYLKD